MLILDLWGISLHAVIVFGLGKNLLFTSVLGHCVDLCQIDDITDYAFFFKMKNHKNLHWYRNILHNCCIVQWLLQEIRPRQDSFGAFFLHHSTLWVFSNFTKISKFLNQCFARLRWWKKCLEFTKPTCWINSCFVGDTFLRPKLCKTLI